MHGEKLRNPARVRRAAAMRQFPSSQLNELYVMTKSEF
jgi:hypothetical protein